MAIQKRNSDMVSLLSTDFPLRKEPGEAWGKALSILRNIQELKALWIAADCKSGFDWFDTTQRDNGLIDVNVNSVSGTDILGPYIELDATINSYFSFRGFPRKQEVFYRSGVQTVAAFPQRIFNAYGNNRRSIVRVGLNVSVAPTGADLIVNVTVNGASIFTNPANRPRIPAGQFTGETLVVDLPQWASGLYLSFNVDQVGSIAPGSNLTVTVSHHYGYRELSDIVRGGLSVGGYFKLDAVQNPPYELAGVWESATNNRCWKLSVDVNRRAVFSISDNGIATTAVTSSGVMSKDVWYYIGGRFDPNNRLVVDIDDVSTDFVGVVPAGLFGTNKLFAIGNIDATYFSGRIAAFLVSGAFLSDDIPAALSWLGKHMLGR